MTENERFGLVFAIRWVYKFGHRYHSRVFFISLCLSSLCVAGSALPMQADERWGGGGCWSPNSNEEDLSVFL
jgi:hypothetical protein